MKNKYINSGRIKTFNFLTKKMSKAFIREISQEVNIVIVFDGDVLKRTHSTINLKIFDNNIEILKTSNYIKEIILVSQCENLEDEIVYSSSFSHFSEIFGKGSLKEHKHEFCRCKNILNILENNGFEIQKFWSRENIKSSKKEKLKILKKDK
ncbi:MAG: hypothetical protein LBV03_03485 [Fusobacteriales bacterium]|nr:hypothetical protein [Fusobacteriales bacterium]